MLAPDTPIHLWHHCHGCGAGPIAGRRYHCETCPAGPDGDLCERCYQSFRVGTLEHPKKDALGRHRDTVHDFRVFPGRPARDFVRWLEVPSAAAPPPPVPDRFVVRPEFRCGLESYFGGHAFVTALSGGGAPLVLTALHVMDELIKAKGIDATVANAAYTGRELPAVVTEVRLYDVFADNWVFAELGTAGPMLVLPGARVDEEEPYSQRDVAAFRLPARGDLQPVPLAARTPAVGEPAYLALNAGARRAIPAVVVERSERTLILRYASDPEDAPRYSSGAPWLDRDGRVIAINVGKGRFGGETFAHAPHVESLRRHLAGADADADQSRG